MYIPKHTATDDEVIIRELVTEHSFGTLIVPRADGVEIAHLPFRFDPEPGPHGGLRVHVARANRIWRDATSEGRTGDIVVVFHGPHGYVSPTWYEHSKSQVPTWNYAVVHAHVAAPTLMDRDELVRLLVDLAAENERGPAPWRLDEHPEESKEKLLQAIVGLSLPVHHWEAKLKLSQNRTPTDYARVVAALEERGTPDDKAMVALMKRG